VAPPVVAEEAGARLWAGLVVGATGAGERLAKDEGAAAGLGLGRGEILMTGDDLDGPSLEATTVALSINFLYSYLAGGVYE
jgi:hypothetical protein